jgi:hypothetical protein
VTTTVPDRQPGHGPPEFDAASRSRSISVRKIFVTVSTAGGRSASTTEITHRDDQIRR